MFVRPFEYLRAESIEEATSMLTERGADAKLLAGGQSLMPMINLGLVQVEALIDISFISGIEGATLIDGALQVGALTRHHAIESDRRVREGQPLLAAAIRHVGNPRVRNVGTVGGSLAHSDPAAELPLVTQVLEAECTVSDGQHIRTIPADGFFLSYFTTALREDEILMSVSIPTLAAGWGWGFHEFAVRAGDFALVAAAAIAHCQGDAIESVRVGLAGVGERAMRARSFEQAAQGIGLGRLDQALDLVTENINPPDDPLASADYRRHLAKVLAGRAVRDACQRSAGDVA